LNAGGSKNKSEDSNDDDDDDDDGDGDYVDRKLNLISNLYEKCNMQIT
jgi:hypothetical protein